MSNAQIPQRVWKVASRWSDTGYRESSILDIFRRYHVVFVGRKQQVFQRIAVNDLIAISDGKKVVAMGQATTEPRPITQLGIQFESEDMQKFEYADHVVGCKVSFTDLTPVEQRAYRIGAFHAVHERAEEFRAIYANHRQQFEEQHRFQIQARSCTLWNHDSNAGDVLWKNNLTFRVPVYQRPYSWQEPQIRKLLSDLLSGYSGLNGKSPGEPMFIGTMQLSERQLYDGMQGRSFHEVIDGQQRLSTLIMILKVLKDRHPDNANLQALNLSDLLETRVSSGAQQQYLREALQSPGITLECKEGQNPYLNAVPVIAKLLDEMESEQTDAEKTLDANSGQDSDDVQTDGKPFNAHEFVAYLLSSVYFVVIETRATLSKTLQIFDAINTSGMDLNGGDVFKVRFYEYLKLTANAGDEMFERISELYKLIDDNNRRYEHKVCNIEYILSLAQHQLIAQYQLPRGLHTFQASTFFDRYFDTLLHVNTWPNFTANSLNAAPVTIQQLDHLIKAHFDWHDQYLNMGQEARCMMRFIWWSRYGRYSYLPILFRAVFNADQRDSERFIIQLAKLLVLYSVWKDKAIYEGHNLMYDLLDKMYSGLSANQIINHLHQKANEHEADIRWALENKQIAHNAKAKGIVCRMSAMLDELNHIPLSEKKLEELLFETQIDIEHIESVNHKDGTMRKDIQEQWRAELHQLGNLMVLEQFVNRSISNEGYTDHKLPGYETSKFNIVRSHVTQYPTWSLELSQQRKKCEIEKLMKYICSIAPVTM